MRIARASDRSVLFSFSDEISLESHHRVRRLMRRLHGPGVLNVHPGYSSVLVSFDPRRTTHEAVEALAEGDDSEEIHAARLVEIPVCYGGEFGPDMDAVCAHTALSFNRVVEMHTSPEYLVYFLGFSPGFPYLGGMPEELAVPRLKTPRKSVPAGSVAIGATQTGVYPVSSPGGWHIIGRTPVRLFDAAADPPALLAMGDKVRFIPIGEDEFRAYPR
jgi:KipI family sensor histidine kinase inhibitor